MRPERHRHLAPFGQNGRMMAFRFRKSTQTIREVQRLCKIAETKTVLPATSAAVRLQNHRGTAGSRAVDVQTPSTDIDRQPNAERMPAVSPSAYGFIRKAHCRCEKNQKYDDAYEPA